MKHMKVKQLESFTLQIFQLHLSTHFNVKEHHFYIEDKTTYF